MAELVERTRRDAMLESQRVDVVAVFCDLRDFTAFAATAEPDAVMTLLAEYHQALGPIITRYEATQTNFSGDGMMMLLNAPLPCPDPAPRAVHMAMDMQAAVQALAVQWRSQGHAIGYGIGIAKGLSTVGSIGYEGRLEYTAIGSPVNLAARLCATAEDGEILTDAAVAEAVGPVVPLVNLGARPVKGFKEEIPTFSVAWRERAP